MDSDNSVVLQNPGVKYETRRLFGVRRLIEVLRYFQP